MSEASDLLSHLLNKQKIVLEEKKILTARLKFVENSLLEIRSEIKNTCHHAIVKSCYIHSGPYDSYVEYFCQMCNISFREKPLGTVTVIGEYA